MTIFSELKEKMEQHPKFRERTFRDEGLVILALRSLDLERKYETTPLDKKEMAEFAKKYDSYRHEWDAVMRECPHLQGSDFSDGKALSQAKQIEFGYEVGYHSDLSPR